MLSSRVIKNPGFMQDAVIVGGRTRIRGFRPTSFRSSEVPEATGETPVLDQITLVETAKVQAERIVAEAQEKATEIMRQAMTQGYSDGMAEGRRIALEECKDTLFRLSTLVQRAVHDREEMVRSAGDELAALSTVIAEKIIRREISTDRSIVLAVVEAALEKVSAESAVRIVVHSDDTDLVREKWSELRGAIAFGPNWEVVGDDRMEQGGCLIETKGGTVDGRLESQLSQILEGFEAGL